MFAPETEMPENPKGTDNSGQGGPPKPEHESKGTEEVSVLCVLEKCSVCSKNLTKAEVARCKADHVMMCCDEDRTCYRALMQQAKDNGRLAQVENLRKNDPHQFSLLVLEFRSKCGSGGRGKARPKFDFCGFFRQSEKGKRVATGGLQVMMIFSDYVKHYQGLSWPLTLTTEQASNRWARELADPRHPRDEIRAPDKNGLPNGEKVTRLAVTIRDYVDTSKYQDDKSIAMFGVRKDKPTQSGLEDIQDMFDADSVLEVDDPLHQLPALPSSSTKPADVRNDGKTRNGNGRSRQSLKDDSNENQNKSKKAPKVRNIKVLLEKNKLSTMTKVAELEKNVADAKELVSTCIALLKEEGVWPSEKEVGIIDAAHFDMGHDVLSSSTELTMLLRLCIAHRLFDGSAEASVAEVEKLVDCDPYLSGLDDLKNAESRRDVLQPANAVVTKREEWCNFKTEADLKAGKDLFDAQVRVLGKIQQSLTSVRKDFESDKKELDKARQAETKKQEKLVAAQKKKEESAAKKKAAKAASADGSGKGGGKSGGRLRVPEEAIEDSDFPVIKSLTQFPAQRRIPVIIVDSEDKIKECLDLVKTSSPFIARPKRGKHIMKLMGVEDTDLSMLSAEMQTFMEEFDKTIQNSAEGAARSSRLLKCAKNSEDLQQVLSGEVEEDLEQADLGDAAMIPPDGTVAFFDKSLSEATQEKLMTDTFLPRAAGLAQGMSYAGIEGNFLASFRWQHSGARLLAIARPSDVAEFFEAENLTDAIGHFKTITPDSLTGGSIATFMVNQICAGDLAFLPFGYFFVEKAINAASITIKATVRLLNSDGRDDFYKYVEEIPKSGITTSLLKVLPKLQFGPDDHGGQSAVAEPHLPGVAKTERSCDKKGQELIKAKIEQPDVTGKPGNVSSNPPPDRADVMGNDPGRVPADRLDKPGDAEPPVALPHKGHGESDEIDFGGASNGKAGDVPMITPASSVGGAQPAPEVADSLGGAGNGEVGDVPMTKPEGSLGGAAPAEKPVQAVPLGGAGNGEVESSVGGAEQAEDDDVPMTNAESSLGGAAPAEKPVPAVPRESAGNGEVESSVGGAQPAPAEKAEEAVPAAGAASGKIKAVDEPKGGVATDCTVGPAVPDGIQAEIAIKDGHATNEGCPATATAAVAEAMSPTKESAGVPHGDGAAGQLKSWEDDERKSLKAMNLTQLKEILGSLGDSEMVKRCRALRKDLLIEEVIGLKRDVKLTKSITAFAAVPPAKRQKTQG